ncbi:hypothetical protein ES708_12196 [subsurface metagenome]
MGTIKKVVSNRLIRLSSESIMATMTPIPNSIETESRANRTLFVRDLMKISSRNMLK